MKFFKVSVFFTILLFISSCGSEPLKVDVSHVEIEPLKIKRMEQDIFSINRNNVSEKTKEIAANYGPYFNTFITSIINNGGTNDTSYNNKILMFVNDKDMKEVYQNTQEKYSDIKTLEDEFSEMFKHYKHYFPENKQPKVITMMSGFNYNIIYSDSTLAIGLEMYLGSENKFYQMLQMPKYKSRFMEKENILPDAVRTWMITEFPYNMDKTDFLSEIIYMGKIMFLTDALLPDTEDSLKIQYTTPQMEYCAQNEFNIWSYFAAQKLLYTTDQAEIMKFTADGPFTTAFSKESAPRIGYWTGWQIVRQFMKNNPEISVEQLMKMKDAQSILTRSKYKPKK